MSVQYFAYHNEIHETKKLLSLIPHMHPDEKVLFDFDISKLDLTEHAMVNAYGIAKYYNGQDLLPHDDDLQ